MPKCPPPVQTKLVLGTVPPPPRWEEAKPERKVACLENWGREYRHLGSRNGGHAQNWENKRSPPCPAYPPAHLAGRGKMHRMSGTPAAAQGAGYGEASVCSSLKAGNLGWGFCCWGTRHAPTSQTGGRASPRLREAKGQTQPPPSFLPTHLKSVNVTSPTKTSTTHHQTWGREGKGAPNK